MEMPPGQETRDEDGEPGLEARPEPSPDPQPVGTALSPPPAPQGGIVSPNRELGAGSGQESVPSCPALPVCSFPAFLGTNWAFLGRDLQQDEGNLRHRHPHHHHHHHHPTIPGVPTRSWRIGMDKRG